MSKYAVTATVMDHKRNSFVIVSMVVESYELGNLFIELCDKGKWDELSEKFGHLPLTVSPDGPIEQLITRNWCDRQLEAGDLT